MAKLFPFKDSTIELVKSPNSNNPIPIGAGSYGAAYLGVSRDGKNAFPIAVKIFRSNVFHESEENYKYVLGVLTKIRKKHPELIIPTQKIMVLNPEKSLGKVIIPTSVLVSKFIGANQKSLEESRRLRELPKSNLDELVNLAIRLAENNIFLHLDALAFVKTGKLVKNSNTTKYKVVIRDPDNLVHSNVQINNGQLGPASINMAHVFGSLVRAGKEFDYNNHLQVKKKIKNSKIRRDIKEKILTEYNLMMSYSK